MFLISQSEAEYLYEYADILCILYQLYYGMDA